MQRRNKIPTLERLEQRRLLANLTGQWRAEDLLTELPAGGPVTVWTDTVQSAPANAIGSPRLVLDVLDRHPVVRFNRADGSDALVVDGADAPTSGAEDFSVAVVFATASSTLNGGATFWFLNTGLVDSTDFFGTTADWGLVVNSVGQVGAGLGGPPTSVYSTSAGLNDGQLHVAVLTRQGGSYAVSVDGLPPDVRTGAGAEPRLASDVWFGAISGGNFSYTGDIAEIRFYDDDLTTGEVTELVNELRIKYLRLAPVAGDDSYALDEDVALVVEAAAGVLVNDENLETDLLTTVLVDQPQHGTLQLQVDGGFTYTPDPDYFGPDEFTYRANNTIDSNLATVQLEVRPVFDRVVAASDSYLVPADGHLEVGPVGGVLANDVNIDAAPLVVTLAEDVQHGQLTLRSDGSFDYRPKLGYRGGDLFRYRVNDGVGNSPEIDVRLEVSDAGVFISEFLASNATGLTDSGGQTHDWLELYNLTNVAAELGGWYLTDDSNDLRKWQFPDGTQIPATGFLVVFASGEDRRDLAELHTSFRIGSGGEYLALVDPQGVVMSEYGLQGAPFPPQLTDISYGQRDGMAGYFQPPTPGASNGMHVGPQLVEPLLSVERGFFDAPFDLQMVGPAGATLVYTLDGSAPTLSQGTLVLPGGGDEPVHHTLQIDQTTTVRAAVFEQGFLPSAVETQTYLFLADVIRQPELGRFSTLELPGTAHLGTQFTLAAQIDMQDQDFTRVFSSYGGTGPITPGRVILDVDRSGRSISGIRFIVSGQTATTEEVPAALLAPGYHHLAATYDDGAIAIYLDGQPLTLTRDSFDGGVVSGPQNLRFGEDPHDLGGSADEQFHGTVDDLLVLGTALSADTISELAAGPAGGVVNGLALDGETLAVLYDFEGSAAEAFADRLTADGDQHGIRHDTVEQTTAPIAARFGQAAARLDDPSLGGGVVLPRTWGSANADYGMDPNVVDVAPYRDTILDDLQSIPTLAVSLDFDDLFGSQGIYSNSGARGPAWERPASAEYFDASGSLEFQIDAGLRVHGGFSRTPSATPQHSLRLHFDNRYGEPQLDFPLFADSDVTTFKALVLNAQSSDNWTTLNPGTGPVAQFMRDQWAQDAQRETGQLHAAGTYVHLYLNGLYWGLYDIMERFDENFTAAHQGGTPAEYDIVIDEVAEAGDLTAWSELLARVRADDYEGTLELLDVDNFIDYMLVNIHMGNWDWPDHNWNAFRRRAPGEKFQFVVWDAEVGMGLDVNIPGPTVPGVLNVNLAGNRADVTADSLANGPGEIYNRLRRLPEFQLRFADRVHLHFANGGALTPERAAGIYEARAQEIERALVGESARWGDVRGEPPQVADGEWLTEKTWILETFFPQRTDIVREQFREIGLFPGVDPPTFGQHGGVVPAGFALSIGQDDPTGTIYWTLDGSDPRASGGSVASGARPYEANIPLSAPVHVKARVLRDGIWSALTEANFRTDSPPSLRISELHYHPTDPTAAEQLAGFDDGDQFEFVELVNVGELVVDLQGVELVQTAVGSSQQGVLFDFSGGAIPTLAPGERMVVVENLAAFQFRYGGGLPVAGEWRGGLSNNREQLKLVTPDHTLQQFTYDDDWHPQTDGRGPSLEVVSLRQDPVAWSTPLGWRASTVTGGTPGAASGNRGDFDDSGSVDASDIDWLLAVVGGAGSGALFDLTADGNVSQADVDELVRGILRTDYGDLNLDGQVDAALDGQVFLANLGRDSMVSWAVGDLDGDGRVTASQDGARLLAGLAADTAVGLATLEPTVDDEVVRERRSTWEER